MKNTTWSSICHDLGANGNFIWNLQLNPLLDILKEEEELMNELSRGVWISQYIPNNLLISEFYKNCPYSKLNYNIKNGIIDAKYEVILNCDTKLSTVCLFENVTNLLTRSPCPSGWFQPKFLRREGKCYTIKEFKGDQFNSSDIVKVNSELKNFMANLIADELNIKLPILINVKDSFIATSSYSNWNAAAGNQLLKDKNLDNHYTLYDPVKDHWIINDKSIVSEYVLIEKTINTKPTELIARNDNTLGNIIVRTWNDSFILKDIANNKPFYITLDLDVQSSMNMKIIDYDIISRDTISAENDIVEYKLKLKENIQTFDPYKIYGFEFGYYRDPIKYDISHLQNFVKLEEYNSTIYNVNLTISYETYKNILKLKNLFNDYMMRNNLLIQDIALKTMEYETANEINDIKIHIMMSFIINLHTNNLMLRKLTDLFNKIMKKISIDTTEFQITNITNEKYCFDVEDDFNDIQERQNRYFLPRLVIYKKDLCIMKKLEYPPFMICMYDNDKTTTVIYKEHNHQCKQNVDNKTLKFYYLMYNEKNETKIAKDLDESYISTVTQYLYVSDMQQDFKIKFLTMPHFYPSLELFTILSYKLINTNNETLQLYSNPYRSEYKQKLLDEANNQFISVIDYLLTDTDNGVKQKNTVIIKISPEHDELGIAMFCDDFQHNHNLEKCNVELIKEDTTMNYSELMYKNNLLFSTKILKIPKMNVPKNLYLICIHSGNSLKIFYYMKNSNAVNEGIKTKSSIFINMHHFNLTQVNFDRIFDMNIENGYNSNTNSNDKRINLTYIGNNFVLINSSITYMKWGLFKVIDVSFINMLSSHDTNETITASNNVVNINVSNIYIIISIFVYYICSQS